MHDLERLHLLGNYTLHILVAQKCGSCLNELNLEILILFLNLFRIYFVDRHLDSLFMILVDHLKLEILVFCIIKLLPQGIVVLLKELQFFCIQLLELVLVLELKVGLLEFRLK